ncbi:hypothetical protein OPV22_018990 [Ensete ventricosum]|uniref:Uncharacterized protein n=1 Tax=Ensete ventricosum TaxID=4639 RepID=A0A444C057_ENSVE|nr:hypothetical protein OPV22_018990 [Ensete ventricosum]RRT34422.1 hypothetical protein B296_00056524 [Ensete ventricosum]RWV79279.1 hypothetical protein GW17_00059614 [Ensete ventricosum]RWW77305.1 hypothetical protein BHE74_00014539 [Ensete ventricosum]RZR80558.1 hypothetical protein BHM03_00006623 [Ensete ventricosum]
MAALSFGHPLHAAHSSRLHPIKPTRRVVKQSPPCRSQLSAGPAGGGGENEKEKQRSKEGKKTWRRLLVEMYGDAGKLGRGLKESLSPKQKGDWKDVALMSFSFAVYVYISQKLVCAYCAWMSMVNHP